MEGLCDQSVFVCFACVEFTENIRVTVIRTDDDAPLAAGLICVSFQRVTAVTGFQEADFKSTLCVGCHRIGEHRFCLIVYNNGCTAQMGFTVRSYHFAAQGDKIFGVGEAGKCCIQSNRRTERKLDSVFLDVCFDPLHAVHTVDFAFAVDCEIGQDIAGIGIDKYRHGRIGFVLIDSDLIRCDSASADACRCIYTVYPLFEECVQSVGITGIIHEFGIGEGCLR